MSEINIASADAYYKAFNEKDPAGIAKQLHPDVQFVAPMGNLSGREAVVEAAKRLLGVMKSIKIREKFSSGDQVMLVYDLYYGEAGAICPSAVLMNFRDGLIIRTELFYDARPFGNL
jgi:ketosteroid isomerase-like protein